MTSFDNKYIRKIRCSKSTLQYIFFRSVGFYSVIVTKVMWTVFPLHHLHVSVQSKLPRATLPRFPKKILIPAVEWISGTILGQGSANEKRRYIVTSSVTDWALTQNDPWISALALLLQATAHIIYSAYFSQNILHWNTTYNLFIGNVVKFSITPLYVNLVNVCFWYI